MKKEKAANGYRMARRTKDISESHTQLDSMYDLAVFSGREVTPTGLLEIGELMPKQSSESEAPLFRFRWDEKANALDIDSINSIRAEVEKFRKGTPNYYGHHAVQISSNPRTFHIEIAWDGRRIYCGQLSFSLEFEAISVVHIGVRAVSSYSVSEASQLSNLSPQHIRYLLSKGVMLGKKLGHDWIVFGLDYKRKRKPKVSRKAVKQND